MKPAPLFRLLVTLLVAAGWSWAEDAPAPAPTKRTFGNGVLPEYLAVYDIDDNGRLSVEETQALRRDRNTGGRLTTFRNKWDTDRDGTISPAERDAAKAAIRQLIIERRCRRFAEVDRDGDEFLSKAEFNTISAVQSVDSDSPGTADDLFRHLDRNGDNRVSKDEFLRSLDAAPATALGVVPSPPHPDANTPSSP